MGQCRSVENIALHDIEERKLSLLNKHLEPFASRNAHGSMHTRNSTKLTADELSLNIEPINLIDILTLMRVSSNVIECLILKDLVSLQNTSKTIHKMIFWKMIGSWSYDLRSINPNKPDLIRFQRYRSKPTNSHVSLSYAKLDAKKYNKLIPYLAFASRITLNHLYLDKSSGVRSDVYPTWRVLTTFKSCVPLRGLTLGSVGIVSSITNSEFIQIIRTLGGQLVELSLIKLNSLTIESLDMIAHYTKTLTLLRIFACDGIRSDTTRYSYQTNSHHIEQLFEAIAGTIEEIDWRYSIEINDQILTTMMKVFPTTSNNSRRLRIFAASRVNALNDADCVCSESITDTNINLSIWLEFIEHFKLCDFLAIDNLYGEETKQNVFVPYISKRPSSKSLKSPLFNELVMTWPIHLPDTFFYNEDQGDDEIYFIS